eukprot:3624408-Prymnesium_polylepis.1
MVVSLLLSACVDPQHTTTIKPARAVASARRRARERCGRTRCLVAAVRARIARHAAWKRVVVASPCRSGKHTAHLCSTRLV